MADNDIRAQVDEFVALPKKERREAWKSLPKEVRVRARKIIEARRGIAYRADGGLIVRTKDDLIRLLVNKQEKLSELPKRAEVLKGKMVELKRQLQENYGDEALVEAENALEAVAAPQEASEAANA